MKLQPNEYFCGPTAVVNAISCFGRKSSVERVAKLAGTTDEGTHQIGILRALTRLGFKGLEFEVTTEKDASRWLDFAQRLGHPIVLYSHNGTHWITVIGSVDGGKRYIVADSSQAQANREENGMHVLTLKRILALWKDRHTDVQPYYGIIVSG